MKLQTGSRHARKCTFTPSSFWYQASSIPQQVSSVGSIPFEVYNTVYWPERAPTTSGFFTLTNNVPFLLGTPFLYMQQPSIGEPVKEHLPRAASMSARTRSPTCKKVISLSPHCFASNDYLTLFYLLQASAGKLELPTIYRLYCL